MADTEKNEPTTNTVITTDVKKTSSSKRLTIIGAMFVLVVAGTAGFMAFQSKDKEVPVQEVQPALTSGEYETKISQLITAGDTAGALNVINEQLAKGNPDESTKRNLLLQAARLAPEPAQRQDYLDQASKLTINPYTLAIARAESAIRDKDQTKANQYLDEAQKISDEAFPGDKKQDIAYLDRMEQIGRLRKGVL